MEISNGVSSDEEITAQNEICCLIEDGNKCRRPAGNASFSKRIQKTVQRKLKLSLDSYVSFHTNLDFVLNENDCKTFHSPLGPNAIHLRLP
jgi:hypothetical protein